MLADIELGGRSTDELLAAEIDLLDSIGGGDPQHSWAIPEVSDEMTPGSKMAPHRPQGELQIGIAGLVSEHREHHQGCVKLQVKLEVPDVS